ncbi:MAG: hypothetical protein WC781_02875 [Candidatus Pacearchaeota archaeon]|jgi:hypothetical protein
MIKKKVFTYPLFTTILTLFVIKLVSAQYYSSSILGGVDLRQGMQQIIDQIVGFLTPVFEIVLGSYSGSEFFFTKVLLLILLAIIIQLILTKTPLMEGYRGIATIIAIIISVIAVRFISEEGLISGIILPYSTLGIALLTILPFLIFVYFIYSTEMSGLARKISWILFMIIFIIMWIYKAPKISDMGNQIYLWTLIVMGFIFIFDKRIQAYFRGEDIRQFERESKDHEINDLQGRLNWLITNGGTNPSKTNIAERKRIMRRLRKLGASYGTSSY